MGHSFIGIIGTLAPVKDERIAIITSTAEEIQKTIWGISVVTSPKIVTKITSVPIKMKVIPSAIHSIFIICLLSLDISPNPLTIDLVGKMWAIPQTIIKPEPI